MNWDRSGPDDGELRLVRPYALTAGRTRPRIGHLAMEAIIVAEPAADATGTRHEAKQILAMCATPVSVAEIAGRLRVPLGTARVLVGDLVADGLVSVHQRDVAAGARPDVRLLERVLDGLQKL